MAETVRVMLYWDGEIIYGQNGVSYNAMPRRFVRVDRKISLTEFISLMYRTTGIDCIQYKLKLISRYPMSFSVSVTYQCVPIEDDGDLHDVLCIPKNFPSLSTVEIYILQEDAQLSSGSADNEVAVPDTFVGSYTQMLNNGSTTEMTPLVDSHGLDQAQSEDEETDIHVETVLEDDCAHIPFYSDIGDVKDSLIDQFDHQRRPVWKNDHSSELQLGMIFKSKEGIQHAVKMWSIRKRRHFKVYESTPTSWFVRCEYYKDKNCRWNVRAKQKKKHNFFEITKLNIRHTCDPDIQTEDHANLDCNMVGRLVQNHVKENPSYKVCDVAEEVKKFGVDLSYKKAWLGRQKAIEKVYGNWESSYSLLPKFMTALQSCNPGTVVEWRHTEGSAYRDVNIFHSVFWAYRPCIEGFKHCRPVISIDGTEQYGKYKEKLLIAVGSDAANHVFPLAFAIVDEESLINWAWFLDKLKMHVIGDRHGICIISDRARGIMRAMESNDQLHPPFVHHRFCFRHVKANFSQQFKNNALADLMSRAACAHQVKKWEATMNQIRELNESAYTWLMEIPREKWTLSHDGGFRYGIMTTNSSESFNSVLKGARRLPITACVRMTFYHMVKYFNTHRTEADDRIRNGNPWPPIAYERYLKNKHKAKYHSVTTLRRDTELYEVVTGVHGDKGGNRHTVDLGNQYCTCGKFNIYKIPCSHVMKVCERMGQLSVNLVDKLYSSQEMLLTFSSYFQPMPHEDYWPPTPFRLMPNESRLNNQSGRPRSTRVRNDMARRRVQRCRVCGENGHNRGNCPNIERLRERARLYQ